MTEAQAETTEEQEEIEPRRDGLTLYQIDEAIRILIEDGVDEETGEIGDETLKALEELEGARDDKLLAYAVVIKEKRALAAVYKAEEERLRAHRKALEKTVEELRDVLYNGLKNGWRKLKDKAAHIYWTPKRALVVLNEEEITKAKLGEIPPEWHPYLRVTVEIAKTKLAKAIEEGTVPYEVYSRVRKPEGKSIVVK